MCFNTLGGEGGGGPGGVEKIHTFYFFLEGFPKIVPKEKQNVDKEKILQRFCSFIKRRSKLLLQ